MKKLVLMFVAIAAISFASCGNKTQPVEAENEEDTVAVVDSIASDSVQADSAQAEAPAEESAE